ncbi:MAG: flagellar motor switch protein FliN [Clostridiales bacterium]|nr:flagellar motor switch protein FliN [Clostridiales bacterium]
MLEPEELKQLAKSVKTFEDTKINLEDAEKKLFDGIFEGALVEAKKALGKIISQASEISNSTVEIIKGTLLSETLSLENYFIEDISLENGITSIIIEKDVVKKISTIITEEISETEEVSEKEIATVNEVVDQMFNAFYKALAKNTKFNAKFEIQSGKESNVLQKENMLQLSFSLTIGNGIDTTVYYLISYEILNDILKSIIGTEEAQTNSTEENIEESVATVQPIRFEEFSDGLVANEKENMDLLMDLQLQVSVELGKVKKPIKEILQFTQGTIVELDRLAGENVDVLVSGKIIAKGEVVVVDQNFGVRITQIVIPEKRV